MALQQLIVIGIVCSVLGAADASRDFFKHPFDGLFKPSTPPKCPPAGFDSAAGFDLTKYISAPWYPLQQMPQYYQPVDQLYCVRAIYTPNNPSNYAAGIKVLNTANKGSPTGPQLGSNGQGSGFNSIVAYPAPGSGPTAASKLLVGPGFLPKMFYGPYWVVAFDPDYTWAIVSGGAPTVTTDGGCSAGNPGSTSPLEINNSGLWLFSRNPLDTSALSTMRDKAKELGLDLSVLKKVTQAGCTYP